VNYKTSAQAGAAMCQRQAQAFWFVQSFMSAFMIYVRSAHVNRPADLLSGIAIVAEAFRLCFQCVQSIAKRG
jgi:hypothetical protein